MKWTVAEETNARHIDTVQSIVRAMWRWYDSRPMFARHVQGRDPDGLLHAHINEMEQGL